MGRKPLGAAPLSPAQRQARRRVRAKDQPRWEYLVEAHNNDQDFLNVLGSRGWDLVAVQDRLGYFKRKILQST